jgi:hypothetical protein
MFRLVPNANRMNLMSLSLFHAIPYSHCNTKYLLDFFLNSHPVAEARPHSYDNLGHSVILHVMRVEREIFTGSPTHIWSSSENSVFPFAYRVSGISVSMRDT